MGVDVSIGPITNLDNKLLDEVCPEVGNDDAASKRLMTQKQDNIHSEHTTRKKSIDIMQESVESDKLQESVTEKETKKDSQGEEEENSGEKDIWTNKEHVVKRRPKKTAAHHQQEEVLQPGWEKHADENGYYYWHVKSGTIQRQPPPHTGYKNEEEKKELVRDVRSSIIYDDEFDATHLETAFSSQPSQSSSSSANNARHNSRNTSQSSAAASSPPSSNMMTSSVMSKSSTSSSIIDLGKDKDHLQKRRSLPPCKEGDEQQITKQGSNANASNVRPMQVRIML